MYLYRYGNKESFLDEREAHEGKYPRIAFQKKPNPCVEGPRTGGLNYFFKGPLATGDFFTMYTGQSCSYVGDDWRYQISSIIVAPKTNIEICTNQDQNKRCVKLMTIGNTREDRWKFFNTNYAIKGLKIVKR
jgi:hypothetical protein